MTDAFQTVTIADLEAAGDVVLDALPFGVIGLAPDGTVDVYNLTEQRMGGLSRARVVGRPFFDAIGICMNNFMVAQRFEDEPDLDCIIDYVLTLRMRPTPVKLRLLQQRPAVARSYVLIQR